MTFAGCITPAQAPIVPTTNPQPIQTQTIAQPKDPIIGVWGVSGDNTDFRFWFNEDGSYGASTHYVTTNETLAYDGTWSTQGGNRYTTITPKNGATNTFIYDSTKGCISLSTLPDVCQQHYIPAQPNDPIIGVWRISSQDVDITDYFNADGSDVTRIYYYITKKTVATSWTWRALGDNSYIISNPETGASMTIIYDPVKGIIYDKDIPTGLFTRVK